ncbi:MAG: 2-aminoadipate transaminase [Legionellaceae bacterium]
MAKFENSDLKLASWLQHIQPSAMQRSVGLSLDEEFISFALGLPAKELFPIKEYREAINRVLNKGETSLQYTPPLRQLKQQIVNLMAHRGVICEEDEIFLTSGAQQGICFLIKLLMNIGDPVLVEEFIYPGFLQVIKPYQPNILTVKTDLHDGIDVDAIEKLLTQGQKPAFIYTITDGHNPIGVSISHDKRKRLVQLAREYQVPIIEDDPYGLLNYDDKFLPPLKAYDKDWVLYVGSFSKILAPSLRVGWTIVPKELTAKLSIIKEGTDINIASLTQQAVSEFVKLDYLMKHIHQLKCEYKQRRDIMLESINTLFPKNITYTYPMHGFFTWLQFPTHIDAHALLDYSINELKIGYIPGNDFYIGEKVKGQNCIRLNFSYSNPQKIVKGVQALAHLFQQFSL